MISATLKARMNRHDANLDKWITIYTHHYTNEFSMADIEKRMKEVADKLRGVNEWLNYTEIELSIVMRHREII